MQKVFKDKIIKEFLEEDSNDINLKIDINKIEFLKLPELNLVNHQMKVTIIKTSKITITNNLATIKRQTILIYLITFKIQI